MPSPQAVAGLRSALQPERVAFWVSTAQRLRLLYGVQGMPAVRVFTGQDDLRPGQRFGCHSFTPPLEPARIQVGSV